MANDAQQKLDAVCPNAETRDYQPHKGAQEPHTCPYAEEINDDHSLCECCEECEYQCAQDI